MRNSALFPRARREHAAQTAHYERAFSCALYCFILHVKRVPRAVRTAVLLPRSQASRRPAPCAVMARSARRIRAAHHAARRHASVFIIAITMIGLAHAASQMPGHHAHARPADAADPHWVACANHRSRTDPHPLLARVRSAALLFPRVCVPDVQVFPCRWIPRTRAARACPICRVTDTL